MAEAESCCELAESCLEQRSETLLHLLPRLPLAGDLEAVHDARVGLRRLRVAWIGFRTCLPRARHRAARLRRQERQLGPLRDAEVRLEMLDRVLGPVAVARDRGDDPLHRVGGEDAAGPGQLSPVRPGLRGGEMEARRALAETTAEEIQHLRGEVLTEADLAALEQLCARPELRPGHRASCSALELARVQLPSQFRRAARVEPGELGFHQRRIRLRKLRYRVELFSPVLGPGHKEVLHELRRLQGVLGEVHDLQVLLAWTQNWAETLPHELRPALRRLVVRLELELQAAEEGAANDLLGLDGGAWWESAEASCLG